MVVFNRLILKNFKSHENTIIEFYKGINVIIGENGAGKSTILEGVSFALFKQHTGKKIDDLVMNNKESMSVELEFSCSSGAYKIIRQKKKNLKSTLFKKSSNGFVELCSGDKEVASRIENILQIDSDLFLNAIYIRQGEIADFINKTPSEKKQLIGKLLGINSLEDAWKNLSPYINNCENQVSILQTKINDLDVISEIAKKDKEKVISLKEDCVFSLNKMRILQNEISELKKDKGAIDDKINKAEHLEGLISQNSKKIEAHKKNLAFIQDKINKFNNAEEQIEALKNIPEELRFYEEWEKENMIMLMKKTEKENLSNDLVELEKDLKSFFDKCSSIFSCGKINDIKPVVDRINSELNNIEERSSEISSNILEIKENEATLKEKIRSLEKSIKDITDIDSQCPICKSNISEENKTELIRQYDENIELYKIEIEENKTNYDILIKQKQEILSFSNAVRFLEAELEKVKDIPAKINDITSKIMILDEKILAFNFANLSEIKEKIEDLKKQKTLYDQLSGFIEDKDEYLKQIGEEDDYIKKITEESDKLKTSLEETLQNIDYQKYQQISDTISKKEGDYHTLDLQLSQNKGGALATIQKIKEEQSKLNNIEKIKDHYDLYLKLVNSLTDIRNLYSKNGIQKDLRDISKPLIEEKTKNLFNGFSFNYSDIGMDDDYDVTLYGPEGKSTSSMISGGEKVAIALALRLGITQAMANGELDTILLDEPTIHLDDSKKYELVDLFKNISALPQMIIVTHETQLENIADNLITIQKQNGVSSVVK